MVASLFEKISKQMVEDVKELQFDAFVNISNNAPSI